MGTEPFGNRHGALAPLLAAALLALFCADAGAQGAPDCDGPAGDPPPNTPQWHQREQENDYCGEQRGQDTSSNPAYLAAKAALDARAGSEIPEDPFRDPTLLNGVRFRSQAVSFTNRSGQKLPGMIFRPCDGSCHDRPARLGSHQAPYPGVIVVHGGAANQEMYLWGSEALAEAGYMVFTFQIPEPDNAGSDTHYPNTKDALDYFDSTPGHPTAAGDVNPFSAELDRGHVGLAGHSAGGVAVSRLGQEDDRVSAIVSWDRAQSSPMPAGLNLRTPALFLVADFNCQRVPVCVPQPYTSPPDPRGPGNKDEDFQRLSAAGIDTMKIALRAATHLDFTQFSPGTGSRYGAVVSSYFTLAWFDRYLRGSSDALARLTATKFDDSADIHNISGGTFDPQTQQNVPARIAGQPVVNRLSFHFRSAYFFRRGVERCEDIRAGCPPAGLAGSGAECLPRRLAVGRRGIGPARLGRSYKALFARYRAVGRRRGVTRFCVAGGGRVFVGSRKSKLDLVATTARGHRIRGLGPGGRLPRARRVGARRLGPGLLLDQRRGGRVLYRVRRGRIRLVAVVTHRQVTHPTALLRRLRAVR